MAHEESYFSEFREKIIGYNAQIVTPYGKQPLVYADWTASGRLYEDIERKITEELGPYAANTHSDASTTGAMMTQTYHAAAQIIKDHVVANEEDVLLPCGTGATGAINKLQRILGMKVHEKWRQSVSLDDSERPVVFLTHMEHHSNHTSWLETIADVVCLKANPEGLVDPNELESQLNRYRNRKMKIGSFTACSNVTGIRTPYRQLAKIMHRHAGWCFVDFAASAPYDAICMHPKDPEERLDAIFFSPHKFLGGPGSSGILIFHRSLYHNKVPDQPGGGTVDWTNPWGGRRYVTDIELREDGGTPGIFQLIRAALAVSLKEKIGVAAMAEREEALTRHLLPLLKGVPGLNVLAAEIEDRIGIVSFYASDVHYNLMVKILNDRYGIQARGGCLCAGTYGHYLLGIDEQWSKMITDEMDQGNYSVKPGWVRISIHPTMTHQDVSYIANAVTEIVQNIAHMSKDYKEVPGTNMFVHITEAFTEHSSSTASRYDARSWLRKW